MRSTTVPAQITTVEDKIAGELNITQLLLLVAPVFGSAAIYVGLPPFFTSATYKIVVIVCLFVVFGTLAIRIKGKIILAWLLILVRYGARPRYYLYNKNDTHLRDTPSAEKQPTIAEKTENKEVESMPTPKLSTADLVRIEQLILDPEANLHFRADKKGALSVHITEVQ
jgi:hypothetical protein